MTNGNGIAPPSAIHGDTFEQPMYGAVPLQIAIPYMMSPPTYTDLPRYWSWARDVMLASTIQREDMWGAAVARTATKFAAHAYTIKDADDSTRKVAASQALLKRANGGEGWVLFAQPIMQDLLTTDNGVFVRVRHADDDVQTIKLKASVAYQGQTFDEAQVINSSKVSKITGLYHLDSLRCMRTGNLSYPVRYQPLFGAPQLLRWDQVLVYADQPSARAELYGVGFCAASRAYKTINKLAVMEQMIYEFMAGKGANKLAFVQGLGEPTLRGIVKAGEMDAQAKGLLYYLGTILGAIPSDAPISVAEILLKSLPQGFDPKGERDNAYLIYANAIGVPVQDIQPLSGQGLGTGTQSVILQEQGQGIGLAAFLKWWEQTVSDRILPATTELAFDDENDLRDQQARAQARQTRGADRAQRITSGEISPAIARQLAADDGDLPQELLAADVTPGGQIADDEKPQAQQTSNPAALELIATEPSGAEQTALASEGKHDALYAAELAIARQLARWAGDGVTEKAQTAQDRAMFARMGKGGGSGGGGGAGLWPKGPDGRRVPPGGDSTPVKARTPEETHAMLMRNSQVHNLTTDQETSLHFYQSQGYESVNNVLRGGPATERQMRDAERTTKNIDQIMKPSRLTENVEVYRGMVASDPAAHAALSRMQPGATLRENGYMSTSADPKVIERFGGGPGWNNPYPGDTPVTMRVRVRAGTRATYLPAARRNSQANSEKELLVDRGATYRVTDRREMNGRVEVDIEVLGHDD